jgi:lipoate-protein ligase A
MALRTYHLSFDSEGLFNCPKYFNNAKDALHVMGFHIYSERQPWLSNTSIVMEDFKKIRYLTVSSGFGYHFVWLPISKLEIIGEFFFFLSRHYEIWFFE